MSGDDGSFSNDSTLATCADSISFQRSQLLTDEDDCMMMIGGLNLRHFLHFLSLKNTMNKRSYSLLPSKKFNN